MFNKLLSNLPFNPSLIHQVVFYTKRLKKEAAVRRIGFAFIALSMILQIAAGLSPAEATLACDPSNNDIIQCGFDSKDEAVRHCRDNNQKFGTLLAYYKVSCEALNAASTQTIRSTDNNKQLMSIGRKAFGKPGEQPVAVPNAGTFYWRYLWSWDSGGPSSYKVLKAKTSDNQMIMVMYDCGNLVRLKDFNNTQPQPDSQLKLAKLNQPTDEVKPGDIIDYTLAFTNKGGTAALFSVHDTLPSQMSFVDSQYGNWIFENRSPNLKWLNNTPFNTFGNTDAFGTPGFIKIRARVNNNTASGTTLCNKAWLQDVSTATKQVRMWSEVQVCNTVRRTCPSGQALNTQGTGCEEVRVPKVICEYIKITGENSRTKRTFEAKAQALNGATIKSYTYDFGGVKETKTSNSTTNTIEHDFKDAKVYDVSVSLDTSQGVVGSTNCTTKVVIKPPDTSSLLSIEKKARNITKNIADANGTTANAGDVIEYSLITKNYGDGEAKDALLQPEDLNDVLEYAALDTDSLGGGVFDVQNKVLSWNSRITIKPGESATKTFRVKVKDPLPQTPRPDTNSNRSSYDLVMTNVYGNTINIKLPSSIPKTTEEVTNTTLPATGPGTGIALSVGIAAIAGFFFARTRLLAQELDIVREEYATTNGGV